MRSPITQKGHFQSVPSVFKCFAEHWSRREGEGVWEEEVEKEVKSSSLPSTFDDGCSFQALSWHCQISPPLGFWVLSNLFLFSTQRRRHWVNYPRYCMPGLRPLGLNIDWCINIPYNKKFNGPFSKFQKPQLYHPNCSRDHDVVHNMWSHTLTVFHNPCSGLE